MTTITVLKLIVSFSLLFVWFFRVNIVKNDFARFGLPDGLMKLVGFLKISIAILYLVTIFYNIPALSLMASIILLVLMASAFGLHLKHKSNVRQWAPSFSLIVVSCLLIYKCC